MTKEEELDEALEWFQGAIIPDAVQRGSWERGKVLAVAVRELQATLRKVE